MKTKDNNFPIITLTIIYKNSIIKYIKYKKNYV